MLENLGLAVASFCVLFGGFFLYVGTSDPDRSHITKIISGAVLLSGGLMGTFLIAKAKSISGGLTEDSHTDSTRRHVSY